MTKGEKEEREKRREKNRARERERKRERERETYLVVRNHNFVCFFTGSFRETNRKHDIHRTVAVKIIHRDLSRSRRNEETVVVELECAESVWGGEEEREREEGEGKEGEKREREKREREKSEREKREREKREREERERREREEMSLSEVYETEEVKEKREIDLDPE